MLVKLKDETAINEKRSTMMSPEFEQRLNSLRIDYNTTWSTGPLRNQFDNNHTWTYTGNWWPI